MITRLLLSVLCSAGCSKSVEISERPRQVEQKRPQRVSPSAAADASSRNWSNQKESSNGISSWPVPACIEDWDLQSAPQERLATAAEHCGAGLKAKSDPIDWRLDGNQPTDFAQLPAGESRCVRAVVVIRDSGYSAHVSLIDTRGRVLAKSSGANLIIVPENGPLCIPNEVALLARISADHVVLSGVALILEGP